MPTPPPQLHQAPAFAAILAGFLLSCGGGAAGGLAAEAGIDGSGVDASVDGPSIEASAEGSSSESGADSNEGVDAPGDAGVDGSGDGEGGCGSLVWSSPACASCTDQSCCNLEVLCAAIPTCVPLSACWNACDGDGGCTNGCAMQYIDAISNYNAIRNCQRNSCAAACPAH
jgi:hypothetical protein